MKNLEVKKLGRPVNENSVRQIKLKEMNEKRTLGLIKRGRPVIEGSKNQLKLERRKELIETGVSTGKRGRPVIEGSVRQLRIAELEMKRANGTLKLGRPKMKKEVEA